MSCQGHHASTSSLPTTPSSDSPTSYASDLAHFSDRTLGLPLRTYQQVVAGHILRSIACDLGLTFTVTMAR